MKKSRTLFKEIGASLLWVLVAIITTAVIGCGLIQAGTVQSRVFRLSTSEKKASELYDISYQKELHRQLKTLRSKAKYDEKNMLLIYNPYQLNVQSMYAYFETKQAAKVSYTIHVDDKKIKDFSQTLYNGTKEEYVKKHEYQLIGLVPGVENKITFHIEYKNKKVKDKVIRFIPDQLRGTEKQILKSKAGDSSQKLSDGLYAVLAENKFMYYYDNDGMIRSEFPVLSYRAANIVFSEGSMYYSISKNQIVEMNRLGRVTNVFSTGKYHLHHDYVFDGYGNLLILGTDPSADSMEDRILELNVKTGKVRQIVDLADIFPDYYKKYKDNKKPDGEYDWMHLNTIQWVGDDSIVVSARETSAIIKISNIYKKPKIEYMLSDESFWKKTKYKKLLYKKASDFRSQTGQHTVTFEDDGVLNDGKYYLHMFNNNIGKSYSRPDYDWNKYYDEITGHGTKGYRSYYYLYYVDETTRTYDLVNSYEVPYSGYVSSTQHYKGNHIVDSGQAFLFGEYDSTGKMIRQFELTKEGKYCYRVYKYDFDGFYFVSQ